MLQAIMKSNPGSRFMYVVDTRPKVSPLNMWNGLTYPVQCVLFAHSNLCTFSSREEIILFSTCGVSQFIITWENIEYVSGRATKSCIIQVMAPYPFHCPSDVTADFHPCLWHSHQSGPSTHPRHQPEKKKTK